MKRLVWIDWIAGFFFKKLRSFNKKNIYQYEKEENTYWINSRDDYEPAQKEH